MLKFSEMWLIDKIKKLFNKGIFLPQDEKNNLISNVRLKNGMLKLGTNIKVDEGYKLAILRYNKVFDLLNSGNYKIDETTVPRLYVNYFRSVKGKGELAPKNIFADLYFVNMGKIENIEFKTFDKIFALANERQVKFNLKGKFSFKINNLDMFMSYFAEEWAVIKNKKLIKEISFIFEMTLSKVLNKNRFLFKDYTLKEEDIEKQVIELMLEAMKNYGIEITDFNIEDILVSKKDIGVKLITKSSKQNEVENEVIKQAEETINSNVDIKSDEYSFVATSLDSVKSDNSYDEPNIKSKINNENGRTVEGEKNSFNKDDLKDLKINIDENIASSHVEQPSPNIFSKEKVESSSVIIMPEHLEDNRENMKESINLVLDEINSNAAFNKVQESKIEKRHNSKKNKKSKNINKVENHDAEKTETIDRVLDTSKLKSCPCCGAKNFADADICCVCKSKLD